MITIVIIIIVIVIIIIIIIIILSFVVECVIIKNISFLAILVILYPMWKEMFYLTTHSTHFIYGYMTSDYPMWCHINVNKMCWVHYYIKHFNQ